MTSFKILKNSQVIDQSTLEKNKPELLYDTILREVEAAEQNREDLIAEKGTSLTNSVCLSWYILNVFFSSRKC